MHCGMHGALQYESYLKSVHPWYISLQYTAVCIRVVCDINGRGSTRNSNFTALCVSAERRRLSTTKNMLACRAHTVRREKIVVLATVKKSLTVLPAALPDCCSSCSCSCSRFPCVRDAAVCISGLLKTCNTLECVIMVYEIPLLHCSVYPWRTVL